MKVGDSFCVRSKDFVWFKVREVDGVDDEDVKMELGDEFGEIGESLGYEIENLGGGDVSDVDDHVKGLFLYDKC